MFHPCLHKLIFSEVRGHQAFPWFLISRHVVFVGLSAIDFFEAVRKPASFGPASFYEEVENLQKR